MIPSTTNKLLVSEDWKKIYQSYRNADFKSYDFETLRRTMITYLRENYPEDFNDYIDSSEYLALVDLIAYLGQNLSFRIDLNARENFLETAERRDSILRLASLISYNAKRNIPASGFLKIVSISTNDNVIDTNGNSLANQIISWNDPTNANWYQQFISIINSAMATNFVFGRPYDSATISGIQTEQYRINSANSDLPVFGFSSSISGTQMSFEVVSSLFSSKNYIYEEPPKPGTQFSFIYKNDNQGAGSSNTGFFVHFRQGSLNVTNFNITSPTTNAIVGVNASNINNNDTWLWQLDASGQFNNLWTKVDNFVGNNIIYNSINADDRNVYSVTTRSNDQIDLNFADGSFGNLPKGRFAFYYRQSNGLNYVIKPEQLSNITLSIPYTNKNGQAATLSVVCSLQATVSNSSASETDAQIKNKAPQNYYLQNRMITAEDYNIAPLTAGNDILKIKSVNRLSSGISKYFDLSDVTGQYSSTNIFADDGILYKERLEKNFEFDFVNESEILGVILNTLTPILSSTEIRNFYLDQYPRITSTNPYFTWTRAVQNTNKSNGYFVGPTGPTAVSSFTDTTLKYVTIGTLIKFVAPTGKYFLPNNNLTTISDRTTKKHVWAKVVSIVGDGYNNGAGLLATGQGPITLSVNIPSQAIIDEIIPTFDDTLTSSLQQAIVNTCAATRNFGLSFDSLSRQWYIIQDNNLDLINPFSLFFQKDTQNINKDNSWMVSFEWTGLNYKVRYRVVNYIFESEHQTAFYVDETSKNYDFVNNTVIKDQINILAINDANISSSLVAKTSSVPVSVLTTVTTSATVVQSRGSTLWINPSWIETSGIGQGTYKAVHPNLAGGVASVITAVSNYVYLSSTATSTIGSSNYITFIPDTVNAVSTFTFSPADLNTSFGIGADYRWQIDGAVLETDGYINPNKINISFFDGDDNGQIDDPDSFINIVQPDSVSNQTLFNDKFVYFEFLADGTRYVPYTGSILAYPTESDIPSPVEGQLYYLYDPSINVVKSWVQASQEFVLEPNYFAFYGRKELKFQYVHNSGQERRIDPSKTNLIDIYVLTQSYDAEYRNWLSSRAGDEPLSPTSSSLEENFSSTLEPIKSISDELVFQPTKYKIIFGDLAEPALQGTFKAVRNSLSTASDNDLKTRILVAIEEFFSIDYWDFGQSFFFSELATYVMNQLTPDVTNFVIVPNTVGSFGSLYEVTCQTNEIFINGATVNDVDIIDAVTASQLKTSGSIVTSSIG
jgi:hypothetical protein